MWRTRGYLGAVDALEAVSEACAWAEARGRDWLFLARLEESWARESASSAGARARRRTCGTTSTPGCCAGAPAGGPGGGREPLEGALCRYLRWRAAPCGGGLSLLPPAAPAPDEVRVVSTSGDLAAGVQRGAPPAASSRPMLNDLMFRKRPIAQG
ncbi:unnamed protein product [Prorocentrum cordatum]|uniref:Uncharacterized protein n=1 Tax=Prorocentrum cordatum TaxID=2364126 RepID=A0ABN9X3E0_9DINO|nr:unnamed protein product [Polarella glacialis]